MRNLLNFLLKYINIIVFLVLEGIALYFLANGNIYHNSQVVKGVQGITNGINARISNVRSYLNLREINNNLAAENSNLRNNLARFTGENNLKFVTVNDSTFRQKFQFTSARVINNSVNRQKNYFTIDKGTKQGIKVDMAVTDGNNAAGVIVGCSDNFSIAVSLLNLDFRVSARIRTNGYFGSLSWGGQNYRQAVLNEIPQNIIINVGDTIETTGYSAVFPEGVMIGTVSDLKKSGSDFYRISIDLFTDFKKLRYVNVIGNLKRTEETRLESKYQ